jgi:hypothetical protein
MPPKKRSTRSAAQTKAESPVKDEELPKTRTRGKPAVEAP